LLIALSLEGLWNGAIIATWFMRRKQACELKFNITPMD
jgi:hypothetical protein